MKLSNIFFLTTIFIFSTAHADKHGVDAREFITELKSFVQTCTGLTCQAPNEIRKIYSHDDQNVVISDMVQTLTQIAWDQAQVWGDTILEGDYQAAGNTRLDAIFALYRENKLVAYRIVYSEDAWNTSECNFNGGKKSLGACQAGRIVEASFVSPSLKTYVTDENQFAEFVANK